MKLRALLWAAGLCVAGQAQAGLLSDDEARKGIQQVEARVFIQEEIGKRQTENIRLQSESIKQQSDSIKQLSEINNQQADSLKQLGESLKQQTHAMLDLQTQIETLNTDLRALRGQNEELVHNLQDAGKRQKDFYIDLDSRIRHFEKIEAAKLAEPPPAPPTQPVLQMAPMPVAQSAVQPDVAADDVVVENRAYELAHGLFKAGSFQKAVEAYHEFLKKFPESVFAPGAHYEMGNAYLGLKDYKNAQFSYKTLVSKYSFSPKVPDAMLNIAECQIELKLVATGKKTLTQIIAQYPGSETAAKAKKRLSTIK